MTHKEDALAQIAALARHHGLTAEDIAKALRTSPEETARTGLLPRLLACIGGILVFAGLCIYIGMKWDDLNSAARVIITLGTGFILFILALVTMADKRYARAATPLFLVSSLLQPTGILVMLHEYAEPGDPRRGVLFMAGVMLLQHAAAFWSKRPTTLAFTSITFGCIFFATACNLLEIDENLAGVTLGTSLLCIAYALGNSRHAPVSPFWYLAGAGAFLFSLFDAVEDTPFEITYLAAAGFLVFLSTWARSRALLFAGTISMLFYIAYYTSEHFAHVVGWPLALIGGGAVLLGLSALALRINNKYIKRQG